MSLFILFYVIIYPCIFVMSNFRVSPLNLNEARDMRKRVSVYEFIKLKSINVLMVQETHRLFNWDRLEGMGGRKDFESFKHSQWWSGAPFFKKLPTRVLWISGGGKGRIMVVKAKYGVFKNVFVDVYALHTGWERVLFFLFLKMLVANGEGNQERQGAGGASNLKGSSNCFTKYARRSIQLV